MKDDLRESKVGYFIAKLSPEKRKRLGNYLKAKYFKVPKKAEQLFKKLELALVKNKVLEEAKIAETFFPGVSPESKQLRQLTKLKNVLLSAVLDFLALENWTEEGDGKVRLLSAINDIEAYKYFDHYFEKVKMQLQEEQIGVKQELYLFEIEMEKSKVLSLEKRDLSRPLKEAQENLESFYYSELHRLLLAQFHLRSVLVKEDKEEVLKQLNTVSRKVESFDRPIHQLHAAFGRLAVSLAPKEKDGVFHKARELIKEYSARIQSDQLRDFYFSLLNHCIQELKKGKEEYLQIYLELNIEMWGVMGLNVSEQTNQGYMKNLVIAAQRSGKLSWFQQLIQNHKIEDPGLKALLLFHTGDFRKSLQQAVIAGEAFRDVFTNLMLRAYQIMANFELKRIESLEDSIKAFEMFISRRKDIPKNQIEGYGTFLKMIRRLYKATLGVASPSRKVLFRLQEELESCKGYVWSSWMHDKIEKYL